ncbi:helicase-exonuclease AddAB subunit AddA [Lactobacillus sp. YT155]|uniref:helicase-exonuclease AddAB subunit AddA n=1 Tax=Lactobacillus sp. YT155 TaxID=3060955 RepID=UPI00265E60AD|nr:helicase-exonuclease AddAB subunit AddA [Lactobacillus sp. YT155]MDO1605440.1 helicase-exonuclease AddAB subunit AddA [Lactobacillus sp. YT155]
MFKPTPAQKQAIEDKDLDILVSAAAGSGKTRVLVERVIKKILSGQSIDNLLIVTFTKLAAKEMKDRVISELRNQINQAQDTQVKVHLQQQLAKIPSANISTLHSFCSEVIKKFYYLIDLDPSFRLMTDDVEQELIKEQAWGNVRDKYYEADDKEFIKLTRNFSNDRDDTGLQELVFQLYNFAITNPNSNDWLDKLTNKYELDTDSFETSSFYTTEYKNYILEQVRNQTLQIKKALKLAQDDEDENLILQLEVVGKDLEQFISQFNTYSYNDLGDFLVNYSMPRAKSTKAEEKGALFDAVCSIRDDVKSALKKIPENVLITQNSNLTRIIQDSHELVSKLVQIEKEFMLEFHQLKLANNAIDFNDLEHFTMDIFNAIENDVLVARDFYQEKFSEIMIDEYQDVNPMQEQIAQMLNATNNNYFMVGDIKQSIYGFRQAAPQLFAGKYQRFNQPSPDNELILLSDNFRSSKTVTEFVNHIFEVIMDNEIGGIEYNQEAKLKYGASFDSEVDTQAEINIIDLNEDSDDAEAEMSKRSAQISFISQKIQMLVRENFQVFDTKSQEYHSIKYSDIAILSRNKNNNTDLVSEFSKQNIPVLVTDSQNYFQTMEIQVMVELLKLIDNPQQDIALVAVLRSPIVQINEDELARIRINQRSFNFYTAVKQYVEMSNDELSLKLEDFLNLLDELRFKANQISIAELIWYIYQETGFLDFVSGMPGGKQRAANLHALYHRADEFEQMDFQGLYRFINFVERIEKKDKDLSQPNSIESDEDAVNVMTIHGSKGLEFPVVFLLDANKKFNQQDVISANIIDTQLGLGIKYLDEENHLVYSTPQRSLITTGKRVSLLAEEFRLLYVALTRAQQKLVIVGTSNNLEKDFAGWEGTDVTDGKIDLFTRLNFQSYQDIIMSSLLSDTSVDVSDGNFEIAKLNIKVNIVNPSEINVNVVNTNSTESISQSTEGEYDDKFLSTVKQILNLEYPYQESTKTTAYQSVSEIKFLFADPDENELPKSDLISAGKYIQADFNKPKFLTGGTSISAAEVGSATHLVLQKLDLKEEITADNINQLIKNLVDNSILIKEVAQRIDVTSIVEFYQSELGKEVLSNRTTAQREYPFSMVIPANELFSQVSDDDSVLIHGIIDGMIETDEGFIIFDYKTDHVSEETLPEAVQKYSGQLKLYAAAVENIKNRPVIGKYLYFLKLNKAVKI